MGTLEGMSILPKTVTHRPCARYWLSRKGHGPLSHSAAGIVVALLPSWLKIGRVFFFFRESVQSTNKDLKTLISEVPR